MGSVGQFCPIPSAHPTLTPTCSGGSRPALGTGDVLPSHPGLTSSLGPITAPPFRCEDTEVPQSPRT